MSSGFISSEADTKDFADLKLLSFSLGDQQYGTHISQVKEVVRIIEVTKVPETPPFVEGVINYRGELVSVLNLKKYLGIKTTENGLNTPIIIVQADGQHLGVIVDSVSEVLSIPQSLIEPIPEIHPLAEFLEGAIKFEGKIVLILNFNKGLKKREKKLLENLTRNLAQKPKFGQDREG